MIKTYKSYISKEEINNLPLFDYNGKIEVITEYPHALSAIEKLSQENVLGFDTETRPSFSKGEFYHVALLQLATWDCVYLFRLNLMEFPEELGELLSNNNIVKAGVAIQDDVKGLQKLRPFNPQGFVDLSLEAKKRGFTSLGLRALSAIYLEERLSKAAKVTNWERMNLTEAQLKYAACDALVGLKIYQKMML